MTFASFERSSVNVVDELSSAKQIVIKLCQVSLCKNLEKTQQEYFKHDIHVDAFGIIRSGERLDKSNFPDKLKYPYYPSQWKSAGSSFGTALSSQVQI